MSNLNMDATRFSRFSASLILSYFPSNSFPYSPNFSSQQQTSLINFIHRILNTTKAAISLPVILVALNYISRLSKYNSQIIPPPFKALASDIESTATPPSQTNSGFSSIFTVCLIIAQKHLADNCYTLKTWSRIFGLSLNSQIHFAFAKKLGALEFAILDQLQWDVAVNHLQYQRWAAEIREKAIVWSKDSDERIVNVPPVITVSNHSYHPYIVGGNHGQIRQSVINNPNRLRCVATRYSAPMPLSYYPSPAISSYESRNNTQLCVSVGY